MKERKKFLPEKREMLPHNPGLGWNRAAPQFQTAGAQNRFLISFLSPVS
jgi:hypothetical protein